MARERSYKDLIAWQKARVLVGDVYRLTKRWPSDELFGLTSQVRGAAIAIPSNIAEGQGRLGPRELAHHLSIAHGSLCEMETQFFIAQDLGYLDEPAAEAIQEQADEVGRLIRALIRSIT